MDNYKLVIFTTLPALWLLLPLRRPRAAAAPMRVRRWTEQGGDRLDA